MHPAQAAGAGAGGAGIFNDRALAMALTAGSGHAEEPLLEAHLPSTAAGGAGLRCRARLGAAAVASVTCAMARYLDLGLGAGDRLFERQAQIVAQIFAPAAAPPPRRPAAEEFSEDVPKNILEAAREVEAPRKGAGVAERRVAELIVLGALLRVGEDLIGFGNFLELLLRLLVAGVAVRVMLERELPISFFNLVFAGVAINTEQFVIVFLVAQAGPLIFQLPIWSPRVHARGIFNFFGGIGRSTHPPSLFELRRVRPTHSVPGLRPGSSA